MSTPTSASSEQLWGDLVEQCFEDPVVVVDLAVEILDATRQRPHQAGAAALGSHFGTFTQPGAAADLPAGANPRPAVDRGDQTWTKSNATRIAPIEPTATQ